MEHIIVAWVNILLVNFDSTQIDNYQQDGMIDYSRLFQMDRISDNIYKNDHPNSKNDHIHLSIEHIYYLYSRDQAGIESLYIYYHPNTDYQDN